jgi:hypothetical protein
LEIATRGKAKWLPKKGRGMRRFLIAMLGVCIALFSSAVAASPSDPSRGADIYGVGGGKFAGRLANFDTSMHSGSSGDFGHVHLNRDAAVAPIDVYVDVTCVHGVSGLTREVQYSGRVRRVSPVPNFLGLRPGNPVSGYASDGGNPSGVGPVDSLTLFQDAVLVSCKTTAWTPSANNVSSGNIVVKLG